MLTRTVYACKRLFMKQHPELMLPCYPLHKVHNKLVMVYRKIGFLKQGGTLELVGSDLIMPGLNRNTKLIGLNFKVFHKSHNTFRDRTEVMIGKLLVLGRLVSHKGAVSKYQVGTRIV